MGRVLVCKMKKFCGCMNVMVTQRDCIKCHLEMVFFVVVVMCILPQIKKKKNSAGGSHKNSR